MPVPSTIDDISPVAAENSPSGTDQVFPDLDNYIRVAFAFIAQLAPTAQSPFVAYGGAPNAIELSSQNPRGVITRGYQLAFRATTTNSGAATINLDGLGDVAAVTPTGAALPAGYIRTDVDTFVTYNGTAWVVSRETEYGANSNGRFVRHANGSIQIWGKVTLPAQALSTQAAVTWTYPATMVAGEPALITPVSQNSGGAYDSIGLAMMNGVYVGTMNTTSLVVTSYSYRNATTGPVVFAVHRSGNWY